jgi:hypothetical protein
MEEYEAWQKAQGEVDAQDRLADEQGGPRLTLVPEDDRSPVFPTDLLPAPGAAGDPAIAAETAADFPNADPLLPMPFDGIALPDTRKRLAGWSAERQRLFLNALAETGSVHLASSAARLSARSAYRLRARSAAFAAGWDSAILLSVGRLSAIALDRAINGRVEQIFADGMLVGERRVPSDKMLTWLLARLDPKRFALPWEQRGNADPQAVAVAAFPAQLDAVADLPDGG